MIHDTFWLTASDHCRLYVNQWLPETALKAVILLAHGMAEHSGRYARLAEALSKQGYGLYALDQRGHGKTAEQLKQIVTLCLKGTPPPQDLDAGPRGAAAKWPYPSKSWKIDPYEGARGRHR